MTDKERFIENSKFAKIVLSSSGSAILVGDEVIQVHGSRSDILDWLVSALRQNGDSCSSVKSGANLLEKQESTGSQIGFDS